MAFDTGYRADQQEQIQTLEEKFYASSQASGFTLSRRMVFAIMIVASLVFIPLMPIVGIPCALVAAFMLIMTLKDPECPVTIFGDLEGADDSDALFNQFSLMRSAENAKANGEEAIALYDKFIDVLVKGNVIDTKTELDDIEISVINVDPPTYEVELHQIGKSQKTLKTACEGALVAYAAYLVSIDTLSPTRYRVTYKQESDIDKLGELGIITYDSLLKEVEADYND